MKNFCDICFTCNDTTDCSVCKQSCECVKFRRCFGHKPAIMWRWWEVLTIFWDVLRNGGYTMSRPLNSKKSWYKVYIKELNTPNILKSQCKHKCDYLLVQAYTGSVAMSIVQKYVVEFGENFRPVYYNKLDGGVPIDNKKVFEE